MSNFNISYRRVVLTPDSGQVFAYALNQGFVTSIVAFLGDIFRSKKSLIEKSKVAHADVSNFTELEKIILASSADEKSKEEGVVLSEKAEELLSGRLFGYVVDNKQFRNALWADVPADKMLEMLDKM